MNALQYNAHRDIAQHIMSMVHWRTFLHMRLVCRLWACLSYQCDCQWNKWFLYKKRKVKMPPWKQLFGDKLAQRRINYAWYTQQLRRSIDMYRDLLQSSQRSLVRREQQLAQANADYANLSYVDSRRPVKRRATISKVDSANNSKNE